MGERRILVYTPTHAFPAVVWCSRRTPTPGAPLIKSRFYFATTFRRVKNGSHENSHLVLALIKLLKTWNEEQREKVGQVYEEKFLTTSLYGAVGKAGSNTHLNDGKP